MKKLITILSITLFPVMVYASHLTIRNASNLTLGQLPDARLDPSSVTLLGPNPSFSNLLSATNTVIQAGQNNFGVIVPTMTSGITQSTQAIVTDNNVVFSNNLTFSSAPVFSGNPSFTNVIQGSVTIPGIWTFTGDIAGNPQIGGNPNFSNNPTFTGNPNFQGTIDGSPNFLKNVKFTGQPNFVNGFLAGGNIYGTYTDSGTETFTGVIAGSPTISGSAIFTGNPSFLNVVQGSATFTGNPRFSGNPIFSGYPNFTGSPTFSSTLSFTSNPSFSGNPTFTGTLDAHTITPSFGSINFLPNPGVTLSIIGAPTFLGTPTFSSSTIFLSSTTFSSATMVNAGMTYIWPSTTPASGDSVLHLASATNTGGTLYWGGDATGGSAAASASTPRSYTLYVGTPGTPNVDTIVGGASSFDAMLASVNAHGLTLSDTAQATIFVNPGLYQISNATIPAGITLVCGSSVVFSPTDNSTSLMTIYGKIIGCDVDMAGRSFVGPAFILGDHANIYGMDVLQGSNDTTANTTLFRINNSTDISITHTRINNFNSTANANYSGGLLNISNSTNCVFDFTVDTQVVNINGNGQSIWLQNLSNTTFGGNYNGVGGRFMIATGASKNLRIGGYYHITQKFVGVFLGIGEGAGNVSTGTIVDGAVFFDEAGSNSYLISFYGDVAADSINGLLIENCYAYSSNTGSAAPLYFISVGQGGNVYEFSTIVKANVTVNMPFLQDGGTGTIWQGVMNIADGVKQ